MKRPILLSAILLAFISAHAGDYRYTFHNIPVSQALQQIGGDHPELNLSFIYSDLDNYHTSACIDTDDAVTAIKQILGFHPITVKRQKHGIYIEADHKGSRILRGTILAYDGEPLPAATIKVMTESGDPLTYGISGDDGRFAIPCDETDTHIEISCLGYIPKHLATPGGTDFGTVRMDISPVLLKGLVVPQKTNFVTHNGNTMIIDVGNSSLGDLPTVDDILGNLPSLTGENGRYSVFGKGIAVIYINNRKVIDSSEIRRIRPKDIRQIEIIGNPGAEFDADVPAVIRIRLKKAFLDGFGTDIMVYGSQGRRFSDYGQLSLSYGTGPVNIFAVISDNTSRYDSDQSNREEVYTSAGLWTLDTDMPRWESKYSDFTATGGINVQISPGHSAGIKATYTDDSHKNGGTKHNRTFLDNVNLELYDAETYITGGYRQCASNIYYEGSISPAVDIIFNGDYVNRTAYSTHLNEENPPGLAPLHVSNIGDLKYGLWSGNLKADWKVTANIGLSAGCDGNIIDQKRSDRQEGIFHSSTLNSKDGRYAFFVQCSLRLGRWKIESGLRYETNTMDYRDGTDNSAILDKTYRRLYPNLNISSEFGKTTMALGLSSRISRPTFYQLRSGKEYFNRFETTEGNPLLSPTYTYDLGYSVQYSALSADIGFQWIKDFITDEYTIDSGLPPHMTVRPVNKPMYRKLYASISYNLKAGIWEPYLSANILKTFYDMPHKGNTPIPGTAPYIALSLSNYFKFNGFTAYITAHYNPAGVECNYRRREYLRVDAGIYRRFLNNSLYLSLQADDILASKSKSREYYASNIFGRRWFRDSRRVALVFSYTFRHENRSRGSNSAKDDMRRL